MHTDFQLNAWALTLESESGNAQAAHAHSYTSTIHVRETQRGGTSTTTSCGTNTRTGGMVSSSGLASGAAPFTENCRRTRSSSGVIAPPPQSYTHTLDGFRSCLPSVASTTESKQRQKRNCLQPFVTEWRQENQACLFWPPASGDKNIKSTRYCTSGIVSFSRSVVTRAVGVRTSKRQLRKRQMKKPSDQASRVT